MMNTISRIFTKQYFEAHTRVYIASILGVIILGWYSWHYFTTTSVETLYTLTQVKKETITSYVSSTGQVIVKNQIDLKPQSSNTIVSVRVGVGDKVKKGQVLAILDQRSALISLKQAEVNLASARASYQKVEEGATSLDLLTLESNVEDNKTAITTAKQNAVLKLIDAFTQANDIVTTKTNTFFLNPNTTPTLNIQGYPLNNQVLQSTIEKERLDLNSVLQTWRTEVNTLTVDGDVGGELTTSLNNLNKVATYLDNLTLAFNTTASSDNTISGYRSTVSSARSSISSLISSIIVQQQTLTQATTQLKQSQATLDLKKAPPTNEDLTISQAQVTSAEASYLNAQTNYANTVITAPFDAVIGAVSGKVGDQASAGTAMFTLITQNQMADISLNEVDATKIKIGQKATLTFDAIPDLVVAGTVAEVSPLGTVSQGVVSYDIKVSLDTQDDRIKPGMSVTTNIITNIQENVLSVPAEAIKIGTGNTGSYVEVPQQGFTSASTTPVVKLSSAPTRKQVTVGISSDTSTEITNGLNESDWVITKTTTSGGTTKTTTTQQSGFSALGGGGRSFGR